MTEPAHVPEDATQTIARLQWVLEQQGKDLIRLNDFLEKREGFVREGMNVFASFHQRVLDTQDQERSRFEQKLAELTDGIARRDVMVARLEGERAGRDVEIARLHSEIAHRDTIRTVQEDSLARLRAQVQAEDLRLRSRTIRRYHGAMLSGLRAADSLWIGLVGIVRGALRR